MIRSLKLIIAIIIIAALAYFGYRYWQHEQAFPSTDDAYVQAHVVNLATRISGKVVSTSIKNQDQVKKGQILFKLDSEQMQLEVTKAQADLANTMQQVDANKTALASAQAVVKERQAQLNTQQKETARQRKLAQEHLIADQTLDESESQLTAMRAQLTAAQSNVAAAQAQLGDADAIIRTKMAAVKEAQLNLSYTTIKAPVSGTIENYSLRVGDNVSALQQIFAIVEDKNFWISANFKETDLERIRINQPVKIKVDMYPKHTFTGKVVSISSGSGTSFSLLPPENASGNWVKVTQRFPIKISIDNPASSFPLRMGASATVTIDASK